MPSRKSSAGVRAWGLGDQEAGGSGRGDGSSPFMSSRGMGSARDGSNSSREGVPSLVGLPKLDMEAIKPEMSSSRMSSALTSIESTDHGPSVTIMVVPDPDAIPEQNDDRLKDDAEGAPASAPASAPAEEEAPDRAPVVGAPVSESPGSEKVPTGAEPEPVAEAASPTKKGLRGSVKGLSKQAQEKLKSLNRNFAGKELLSPEKAARMATAKAAMKGDLGARRQATEDARRQKLLTASAKKGDQLKHAMAMRIQARERGRQAIQFVRNLRKQSWATGVIQRGMIRWRQRVLLRLKAKEEEQMMERLRQERIEKEKAEKEAARQRAKEEAERKRREKEEEES